MTAGAVRERCRVLGEKADAGELAWFRIDRDQLEGCVDRVVAVCQANYPDGMIPFHSRWRHFDVAGTNLWHHYREGLAAHATPDEVSRMAVDLVFISVLVDAGAGSAWRYRDPVTGQTLQRSEGLAAASLAFFFDHLSRPNTHQGRGVDVDDLRAVTVSDFERAFQVDDSNPLVGVQGRVNLLHGLADALEVSPESMRRPGDLVEVLAEQEGPDGLPAARILETVLARFNAMWPNGLTVAGVPLGDAGYHGALAGREADGGIVPFHKLSQWLSYSLIEPLGEAGVIVSDLDGLTGLPEYRNGGLFLDSGVIEAVDPRLLEERHPVASEPVVEWRALTVYLLDAVAERVRQRLGLDAESLPLASVLQGGTWAAGRAMAMERRKDGSPPIRLAIDGTVF